MFSLLWSEHCAYKHSKKLLRTLPTEGPHVVMGPGENAGAVDVGGWPRVRVQGRVAQPPERGRAVPGRGDRRRRDPARHLRDRRAPDRGARLAALRRAGGRAGTRSRYLLDGAVAGIGHYGNSIGVPTVGGEVYFEGPYEHNCLVNAMALGLAERDALDAQRRGGRGQRARAVRRLDGPRRDRRRVGAGLGRARRGRRVDGPAKRPTVQVGDPFEEKKLLECSLELLAARAARLAAGPRRGGADELGASEMASKGEVGIDIDVERVPLREADMEPFEIMVSESQERMLCVGRAGAGSTRCWRCARSGRSTARRSARSPTAAACASRRAASSSATCRYAALVDDCPLYDLAPAEAGAAGLSRRRRARRWLADATIERGAARAAALARTSPRAVRCSSSTTRSCSRARCAGPSRPTRRCWRCRPTPRASSARWRSASTATAGASPPTPTAARSRACSSARRTSPASAPQPLGTTNNLNFGNPEKPHIAWQLTEAVRGLGDACRALEAPIVGGNVSLYNEGADGADLPDAGRSAWSACLPDARARRAPRLRARGRRDRARRPVRAVARARSELAKLRGEALPDGLAEIDVAGACARRRRRCARRCATGALSSAHDIAEGGLRSRSPSAAWRAGSARVALDAGGRGAGRGRRGAGALRRGPGRLPRLGRASRTRWQRAGRASSARRRRALGTVARRLAGAASCASRRRSRDPRFGSRTLSPRARRAPPELALAMPPVLTSSVTTSMRDGPRDECGVFGIYAPGHEVSRLSYFALYALQHRGQESAGIAAADRGGHIITRASWASSTRCSRSTTCAPWPATWRSATCATRRPAPTRGRTRSRCSARRARTARAASWRWRTTAT